MIPTYRYTPYRYSQGSLYMYVHTCTYLQYFRTLDHHVATPHLLLNDFLLRLSTPHRFLNPIETKFRYLLDVILLSTVGICTMFSGPKHEWYILPLMDEKAGKQQPPYQIRLLNMLRQSQVMQTIALSKYLIFL